MSKKMICSACGASQFKKCGRNLMICDFCGSTIKINENEEIVSDSRVKTETVRLLIKASYAVTKEDYDEALKYLEEALELDDYNAVTLNKIGMVYRKLYQYDLAKEFYLKALEINREFGAVYSNLGVLEALNDNHEEAIAFYEKALSLMSENDIDYCSALGNYGYSKYLLGYKDEGLKKIIEADKRGYGKESLNNLLKLIKINPIDYKLRKLFSFHK